MIQEFEVNSTIAAMAGSYTSGYMQGGSDNARFALYAAIGAAAVAYVVRGALGSVEKRSSGLESDGKFYAANDDGTMRDFEYSNGDGVDAAQDGMGILGKMKLLFRKLITSPLSRLIRGIGGAGIEALDVGVWKDVDRMTLYSIMRDCVGSGACDVSVTDMYNNYPASRQQLIDAIRQSGYRRRP